MFFILEPNRNLFYFLNIFLTNNICLNALHFSRKPRKDIHFTSGWKRVVSLEDLYRAGVVSESTIEQLEEGKSRPSEIGRAQRVHRHDRTRKQVILHVSRSPASQSLAICSPTYIIM